MFCREQVARLAAHKDEIAARGASLVAIGNGTAYWGKAFVEAENVDFPVYADPGRESYKAFGMKHSVVGLLKPKVLQHGIRAAKKKFKQTATRGNPFQNGGVVVLDAAGEVRYIHVESETGDLADMDEVMAALSAV